MWSIHGVCEKNDSKKKKKKWEAYVPPSFDGVG